MATFKILGLRSLAWVSGMDPRQWALLHKGLVPRGATVHKTAAPAAEPKNPPRISTFKPNFMEFETYQRSNQGLMTI